MCVKGLCVCANLAARKLAYKVVEYDDAPCGA